MATTELSIVSWNLRRANRRAWAYLSEEARADVALVQESSIPNGWQSHWIPVDQRGRPWGSMRLTTSSVCQIANAWQGHERSAQDRLGGYGGTNPHMARRS